MAMNLTQKILSAHLLSGELIPGSEISIRIDQTLTQDSTGTMAYLQFEAMGVKRVKTKKSGRTLTITRCKLALKMRMTTITSKR